ncbi:C69 family dipeptidase [Vagococcus fluvialis]|uniref:C69 family dipeptidase n=1 Tax=Vagococcus fluvialis TaxID=2738 RepID=UPI003B59204F
MKKAAGVISLIALALSIPTSVQACTTVLVGKEASVDGSTMIARNEDMGTAWAKHFYVRPENSNDRNYVSKGNGFKMTLPKEQMKYTATPEWDDSEGLYESAGINSKNITMSATESATTKEEVLKLDPHVENGIAEDSLVTVVLPYITSAKNGVEYLGKLIDENGSAETNGIIFSDKNDIWYMELLTGHEWVAVRIPDDQYAVISNTLVIQKIDWNDKENVMYSKGLKDFIKDNKLADKVEEASIREVFADTESDAEYNLPRIMMGQQILTPSEADKLKLTNDGFDLFKKADEKVTLARVGFVLRNHFNGTEYDTYTGDKPEQFRPINVPRTMESHILQVRNDVPEEISGIHWLAMGVPETSSYVPFYSGITETPKEYQIGTDKPDTESAYWNYRMTNVLTVPYYEEFKKDNILPVRKEVRKHLTEEVEKTDKEAEKIIKDNPDKLPEYLNKQTKAFSDYTLNKYKELNNELIIKSTEKTKVEHKKEL